MFAKKYITKPSDARNAGKSLNNQKETRLQIRESKRKKQTKEIKQKQETKK